MARQYLAGTLKGYFTDFSIGPSDGTLGLATAETSNDEGEESICNYLPAKNLAVNFDDNPDHKAIVARTEDGHIHIYYGVIAHTEEGYPLYEPLVFLGKVDE